MPEVQKQKINKGIKWQEFRSMMLIPWEAMDAGQIR